MKARLIFAASICFVSAHAFGQIDQTDWMRSYFANKDETDLKLDRDDNVYLAYVSGTPAYATIKKFAPDGTLLWTNSLPYEAQANTRIQLVIGPDGDPYIGWASTAAELRRLNKTNGKVKWTITPPMPNFRFSVYEKVSVYGDRPAGSSWAAQCLTYTLEGKLTTSTGFESGYRAGQIWDGLITYDNGSGPVTQRMLVKTRHSGYQDQLVIGNETYVVPQSYVTQLTVNQAAPESEIILGASIFESTGGFIYRYGEGLVARDSHQWLYPPVAPETMPTSTGFSPIAPFRAFVSSAFIAIDFDSRTPNAGTASSYGPSSARNAYAMDRMGQIHTLQTRDGGAKLNNRSVILASTYARSPQLQIDSHGNAYAAFIRQNGSSGAPAIVLAKVHVGLDWVGRVSPYVRDGHTVHIDLRARALGCDDGTDSPHFEITQFPAHGTAVLNDVDELVYTPNPGYTGIDTYRYRVSKIGASIEGQWGIFVSPPVQSFTSSDANSGMQFQATLTYSAPTGVSESFSVKSVPSNAIQSVGQEIGISAGSSTGSVLLRAAVVAADTTATLEAHTNYIAGEVFTTSFTIHRAQFVDLTIPASIQGGKTFKAFVYLDGTAPSSISVSLADDSAFVTTPASVTISTGNLSAYANCTTLPVTTNTNANVTATQNATSITKPITLTP